MSGTFAEFLENAPPPDPRWSAILQKVAEMEADRRTYGSMSYRGTSYTRPGEMICHVAFDLDPDDGVREQYVVHCTDKLRVKLEGPFTDAHDEYWGNQYEYDKGRTRFGIVDNTWTHYTISPDASEGNRDISGFGGREFRFLLTYQTDVIKAQQLGLTIITCDNGQKILVSHNVWYQGVIPKKFRSDSQDVNYGQVLFIQNATTLMGEGPTYVG